MQKSTPLLAGKYEPIVPIAEGGMASVWRGLTHGEAGFRRKIAIKRIHQKHVEDQKFAAMFVDEAHIVAELNHPNIVQVHDFGSDEWGNYFIVMEWVEGLSLAAYIDSFVSKNLLTPWALISAIGIEVLRAMNAAHEHKCEDGQPAPVIHRDINPSNILLGSNGVVKLADFGLARAMNRASTTDPGIVKGKVAYMAPEVLDGSGRANASTDIYSIGVVLWEACTGQRLFGGEGTDIDIALKVLKADIPPLESIRDDLPNELINVVKHALARKPKLRFKTARSVIDVLSALLRNHPSPTNSNALGQSVAEAQARLAE